MTTKSRLEHYRQGYPRLAAFLNLDANFTIFRRFDTLHLRVLLEQQDRLCELQQQLEDCDDAETIQLNLKSRRQDDNNTRRSVLQQVAAELKDYDKGVLRYQRMMALPRARKSHRRSVHNWVNGNKPVVRSESASLIAAPFTKDYIALNVEDSDRAGFELFFDRLMQSCPRLASYVSHGMAKTIDHNVFILRRTLYERLIKCLVALCIPMGIIFPMILLYWFEKGGGRSAISAIFVLMTSFAICFMTKVTKYNLLLAVVAYAAVLSAFLSNP
ncbi:uncharacterized protein LY89DRAFT_727466 [Mollisia scopiformis]|uniref:DUF6594 domain-containing protein n=1 Tax=Mollisia scopiformis TaxID=149040 RepID=A0A194XWP1_MOLSC|nr:uncharacterized protein LY89DRAFT_727466 [Mollisia scopiformis]KUJ24439.1 hypothetical protein LY89DRAFT_727466 [Mollisia scopiformis]